MEEPPFLLAGPILRRADHNAVSVFVVTSQPAALRLVVYDIDSRDGHPNEVFIVTEIAVGGVAPMFALGRRLFCHLAQAKASAVAPFPSGRVLGYRVIEWVDEAPDARDGPFDSDDLWLSVCCPTVLMPTFVLQTKGQPLRILLGSCRKLHGEGGSPLPEAKKAIAKSWTHPTQRPHAMFLVGDQIYADDVADGLIEIVGSLGRSLVGGTEALPGVSAGSTIRPRSRAGVLNGVLSSSECSNHLMTFGEFCAMYLVSWNETLWATLPSWEDVYEGISEPERPPVAEAKPQLLDQLNRLTIGRGSVQALRWLLANVPTYMMFDDHEVTDDWNLSNGWKDTAVASPLGRRIIANAMVAYAVFQHWGNNPDAVLQISDWIALYTSNGGRPDAAIEDSFVKLATDSDSVRVPGGGPRSVSFWSYVTPTEPRVIVLDCRTQRGNRRTQGAWDWRGTAYGGVPMTTRASTPRLVNDAALRWLSSQLDPEDRRAVIVTGTPMIGSTLAEKLQDVAGASLIVAPVTLDLESWVANPESLLDIMSTIADAGVTECVTLSGDVHYAFAASSLVATRYRVLRHHQITCSALQNVSRLKLFVFGSELSLGDMAGHLAKVQPHLARRNVWRLGGVTKVAGWMCSMAIGDSDDLVMNLALPKPDLKMASRYVSVGGRVLEGSNNFAEVIFGKSIQLRLWVHSGGTVETRSVLLRDVPPPQALGG